MNDRSETSTLGWPEAAQLRWAAAFAAVVMLLTCLPYLYGLFLRPQGYYYSGLLTNPDEHNVYLSYMKQASEGHFFLIDPFTSEPQAGRVVNVFFLLLGSFSRATHLGLPITYQVARALSGWLLLMAIYCLGAQVLSSLFARRLALFFAAFASGLGWLFQPGPGQPHPIDYGPGLVMPEAITFLSLLLNPLFCFSMFLMVAIVGLGAHALSSGSVRSAGLAGLAALVLGNIHTYDLIPVGAALAAYLLWLLVARQAAKRALALAALMALIAAPSLAYQLWLILSGEVTLAVKTAETPVYSPPPLMLALGLGIPLALAFLGCARRRGAPPFARLLAVWLLFGLLLAYAPVPFQRKLVQGVQIPMVLLAAFAIEPLLRKLSSPAGPAVAAALVAIMLPSNVFFVGRAIQDLQTNNNAYIGNLMPPLYLRADQHAALMWLDDRGDYRDVLLCNPFLGSYAPSLAGTRVYVGHWAETLHFREKLTEYSRFLRADTPDLSREALVRREGVSYLLRDRSIYDEVFYLSPDGKPLPAFDPGGTEWLEPVYSMDEISGYRVK
ncbi:MAG TPA: hypothetical protein VMY87_03195 [Armatimonadota bacterium]|nr:hypothetical protein [Armatimonadota bacterium]